MLCIVGLNTHSARKGSEQEKAAMPGKGNKAMKSKSAQIQSKKKVKIFLH
jgi:hypothetical protein